MARRSRSEVLRDLRHALAAGEAEVTPKEQIRYLKLLEESPAYNVGGVSNRHYDPWSICFVSAPHTIPPR